LQQQGFHLVFVQEVSEVLQPGMFTFSYERKQEEKTKTAGKIDGQVLFTAGQFARAQPLMSPLQQLKSNVKS